jgi:hypothetical protein
MADTKISALTEDTSPAVDSLVATVDDPAGTPASRRTTLANLAKGLGSATLTHQTDEASAEVLKLVGPTRATSADGDEAYISFFQDVDDGVEEMGRIRIEALDVSTGTEDSIIAFEARAAGSALSGETDFEIGTASVGLGRVAGYPQIQGQAGSATTPTYTWWTDNDSGLGRSAADIIHLIAGGLNVVQVDGTVGTKGQVLLPQESIPATPTLAFGDGNTGFYENADNILYVGINGSGKYYWDANNFVGAGAAGMSSAAASATVPAFKPHVSDSDTGLGRAAGDQLSLIAGGIEALRITEASSINTFDFDAGDNVAPQVGALTSLKSVSATVPAASAATLTASSLIPAGSFVLGITARIETTFDNSSGLTSFSVGDGSDADRWGTGIAITAGTTVPARMISS